MTDGTIDNNIARRYWISDRNKKGGENTEKEEKGRKMTIVSTYFLGLF